MNETMLHKSFFKFEIMVVKYVDVVGEVLCAGCQMRITCDRPAERTVTVLNAQGLCYFLPPILPFFFPNTRNNKSQHERMLKTQSFCFKFPALSCVAIASSSSSSCTMVCNIIRTISHISYAYQNPLLQHKNTINITAHNLTQYTLLIHTIDRAHNFIHTSDISFCHLLFSPPHFTSFYHPPPPLILSILSTRSEKREEKLFHYKFVFWFCFLVVSFELFPPFPVLWYGELASRPAFCKPSRALYSPIAALAHPHPQEKRTPGLNRGLPLLPSTESSGRSTSSTE
jgi:hypothetical protein